MTVVETDMNQQWRDQLATEKAMLEGRAGWDRSEYGDGGFESGFFGATEGGERWAAWHGLGNVIPDHVLDAVGAMDAAGLNWTVEKVPAAAVYGDQVVMAERKGKPTQWATVRVSPEGKALDVLGYVSGRYHTYQNADLFQLGEDLVGTGEAIWHTAGALQNGRRVWMLAVLGEDILVGGLTDERIRRYLALTAGHDGRASLKVFPTPVRFACTNTVNLGIRGAQRIWTIRHTSDWAGRHQEIRKTLQLSYRYYDAWGQLANDLVEKKLSKRSFDSFMTRLMPYTPAMEADEGGRAAKNRERAMEAISNLYHQADNLNNVRGTAWGALQAVGEYRDWVVPTRDTRGGAKPMENRFDRSTQPDDLKDRAAVLLAR